jgi:type IX secretion system PorP/SprF family membrane protein
MRKKRFLLLMLVFAFCNNVFAQQEALTTQFMFNKLILNPAYQTRDSRGSVNLMARDQWVGFDGALSSQVLSVGLPFVQDNTQIGLNLKRYQFGITNVNSIGLVYNYGFKVGSGYLSGGFEGGFRNFVIDYSDPRLVAAQGIENDPAIPKSVINKNNFNLGLGIYYRNDNFYFGISSPYVFSNAISLDQTTILSGEYKQILGMLGYQFRLSKDWSLMTQSLVKLTSHHPLDLDFVASTMWKSKTELGVGYRLGGNSNGVGESAIITVGVHIFEDLYIGVAYDYPLSALRSVTIGNIELVSRYQFERKKTNYKGFNPRFF